MEKISITHFFETSYTDYAKYVLSTRAIPSLIDGMRVGGRKILNASAMGSLKKGGSDKFLTLVGDVMSKSAYHHGDTSLHNTIVMMSRPFRHILHPFEIEGQIGTIHDEGGYAAPRYLSIQNSIYHDLYLTDEELLDYLYDGEKKIEPYFYLPIIPTILLLRTNSIGLGYAFSTFSYNPFDIIDGCIAQLIDKDAEFKIRPYVRGYNNSLFKRENERWVSYGNFEIDLDASKNTGTVRVTELPYDVDFDGYEDYLNNELREKRIQYWENYTTSEGIDYLITFDKNVLKEHYESGSLSWYLKLYSRIDKDNLTVLNEEGKILYFSTPELLLKYFVKFRLSKYSERKTLLVKKIESKIEDKNRLKNFIYDVVENKLIISKRPIDDIIVDMTKLGHDKQLINVSISKLTKDEIQKLDSEISDLKTQLEYILSTTERQMYLNDLLNLRKTITEQFENGY